MYSDIYIISIPVGLAIIRGQNLDYRYFWRFSEYFGCVNFCVDNFEGQRFFVGHIKALLSKYSELEKSFIHALSNQTRCTEHKHVISKQSMISLCSNSIILVPRPMLQRTIIRTRTHTFGVYSDIYFIHIGLAIIRGQNLEFRYFWRFSEYFGCVISCVDNF